MEHAEVAIVGAGAAGLMGAIWAGRENPGRRIVLLDGAAEIGAKILISGGGRCNVTHHEVEERAFSGSTPGAIRKVLRRFGVAETLHFFAQLGVEMKRESTGKLFPVSDRAQSVLDALLQASEQANVILIESFRVQTIAKKENGFRISNASREMTADKIILATGGKSVPQTGSDGHGYGMVRSLGHTVIPVFPALVPLILPAEHFICSLAGVTLPASLTLRGSNGRLIVSFTDSTLCAHFGLSGPSVLDISRHYTAARRDDPGAWLEINWSPAVTLNQWEEELRAQGSGTVLGRLRAHLPERLARAIISNVGMDGSLLCSQMSREQRKALCRAVTQMHLPVVGDRGFRFAEVTAGGVPLSELNLNTMESRLCPGLFLCGEICDVDGRIGGFNFQWAWSSGYIAGVSV